MVECQKLTQEQKEIKRLIKQSEHKNSDVRMTAAGALGSIGTKGAVPALIHLLKYQEQSSELHTQAAGVFSDIH